MKIIYSARCLEYYEEGDEEAPFRVKDSYELLKKNNFSFVLPIVAGEKDILMVHSKELLDAVKTNGKTNRSYLAYDITNYGNIFYYASLAAGAAINAMEMCSEDYTFSLMRPPGHHAGRIAEGFCFFNNMAIAVKKAFNAGKANKIAILDIDLHHGNGTQDIFFGDDRVLFVSLHQSPLYPETGLKSEANCINFPLSEGTGEKEYLKYLGEAIDKIKKFNPDLVGVSAGFDTYKKDPLGKLRLEIESYEKIAKMIKTIGKPVFSILEGGYSQDIPLLIESYIRGFD